MKVDLHIHSTHSDGTSTVKEIVDMLEKTNIGFAALTDHDILNGADEFLTLCESKGIIAVPGIELSALDKREVHILGYGLDYKNKDLLKELDDILEKRQLRNKEIVRKLRKQKIYIKEEEVLTGIGSVGRMHIARALKRVGYVKNENEAFERWLGVGKSAYVPSYRLSPIEAISLIKRYGGISVLAHPFKIKKSDDKLVQFILDLKEKGLDGIEAHYATHSPSQTLMLEKIADENNLLVTYGSDYHGEGRASKIGQKDFEITKEKVDEFLDRIKNSKER